jgi:acyl-CoA hydrolase
MSEINFINTAKQGDIVEIGIDVVKFGKSSLVLRCVVRNMMTREEIISIENITMVNLDKQGKPLPHGKTEIEFVDDRLKKG